MMEEKINILFAQEEKKKIEYRIKEIEKDGLKFYDNNKDLIIEFMKNKLELDLKYFENKIKEGVTITPSMVKE